MADGQAGQTSDKKLPAKDLRSACRGTGGLLSVFTCLLICPIHEKLHYPVLLAKSSTSRETILIIK